MTKKIVVFHLLICFKPLGASFRLDSADLSSNPMMWPPSWVKNSLAVSV